MDDVHIYRIAIASSDGINVDTHFGHAFSFIIADVNEHMPNEEVLFDLSELFKVFGDSTRIRILFALFEAADLISLPTLSPSAAALIGNEA